MFIEKIYIILDLLELFMHVSSLISPSPRRELRSILDCSRPINADFDALKTHRTVISVIRNSFWASG